MKFAPVIVAALTIALAGCAGASQSRHRRNLVEKPEAFTLDSHLRNNPAWVPFTPYFKQLIEQIQTEWDKVVAHSRYRAPEGSWVTVKFVLNSEGRIDRIVDVENNSNEGAARLCVSAITSHPSYGRWTPEMKASLGDEQELTFTFYYQ